MRNNKLTSYSFLIALSSIVLFLCCSCGYMKYNYNPTFKNVSFPELNTEMTAYIGDKMLSQGKFSMVKVLQVNSHVSGVFFDIPKGDYIKQGQDDKKEYFSYTGSGGAVVPFTSPPKGMYVSMNSDEICVINLANQINCYKADFTIKDKPILIDESKQKTILYSGRDGNKVTFTYTERVGNTVVFTHNVTYDISKDKIIGYKGVRIKILDATNEEIKYIVLQNFPSGDE